MSDASTFHGDKKFGKSFLWQFEHPLQKYLAARVPKGIETYHLTLMTIPWGALIILFGYFAQTDIRWMHGISAMIVLQYVTDLLDGEVGRQRNTGLLKWGYYMDHFLDFMFLCAMLIGYFFILPSEFIYIHFFLLCIFGAFMVNSFLSFAATGRFQVTYAGIGPTEIRIVFILVNTLLAIFGTIYVGMLMPYILLLSFLGLCVTVYRTQKEIWRLDVLAMKK